MYDEFILNHIIVWTISASLIFSLVLTLFICGCSRKSKANVSSVGNSEKKENETDTKENTETVDQPTKDAPKPKLSYAETHDYATLMDGQQMNPTVIGGKKTAMSRAQPETMGYNIINQTTRKQVEQKASPEPSMGYNVINEEAKKPQTMAKPARQPITVAKPGHTKLAKPAETMGFKMVTPEEAEKANKRAKGEAFVGRKDYGTLMNISNKVMMPSKRVNLPVDKHKDKDKEKPKDTKEHAKGHHHKHDKHHHDKKKKNKPKKGHHHDKDGKDKADDKKSPAPNYIDVNTKAGVKKAPAHDYIDVNTKADVKKPPVPNYMEVDNKADGQKAPVPNYIDEYNKADVKKPLAHNYIDVNTKADGQKAPAHDYIDVNNKAPTHAYVEIKDKADVKKAPPIQDYVLDETKKTAKPLE